MVLRKQIIFLGALSRDDVAKWMNKCDCLFYLLDMRHLGYILKLLPVEKTCYRALNGGAEDIINNLNGYLVPIDDIDKLAEKMLELYKRLIIMKKRNKVTA